LDLAAMRSAPTLLGMIALKDGFVELNWWFMLWHGYQKCDISVSTGCG